MAATDTALASDPDAGVDDELVHTIEEDDILVVNGNSQTWDVTDVVKRSIDDPADERLHKRVCRLHSQEAVFGLLLVEYPDCHEATLHVLETNEWTEQDQTYPVQDANPLSGRITTLVRLLSSTDGSPSCTARSDDESVRTVYNSHSIGCPFVLALNY